MPETPHLHRAVLMGGPVAYGAALDANYVDRSSVACVIGIMAHGTSVQSASRGNGASHGRRAPLDGEATRAERTEVSP
ncbi:hypothetical protein Mro03_30580 [Microbispora rosea subsp. rosea]|nr:hypothetical protein Mro03_30580 [Microbispora rosea subsp. rosea]